MKKMHTILLCVLKYLLNRILFVFDGAVKCVYTRNNLSVYFSGNQNINTIAVWSQRAIAESTNWLKNSFFLHIKKF